MSINLLNIPDWFINFLYSRSSMSIEIVSFLSPAFKFSFLDEVNLLGMKLDEIEDRTRNFTNEIYKAKKKIVPILENYSIKAGYKRGAKNFIKEVIQKLAKK